jgi:hypothetical protein
MKFFPLWRLSHAVLVLLVVMLGVKFVRAEYPGSLQSGNSYAIRYESSWNRGIEDDVLRQTSQPNDISVIADPLSPGKGHAILVMISPDENFSKIANGLPRAEIVFPVRFRQGHEYLITWKTYIPSDYPFSAFDTSIITQIHQGFRSGSPPVMLTIHGDEYTFSERGGLNTIHGRGTRICCATSDKSRWITWTLSYVPSASGGLSQTRLSKDGVVVFESIDMPNAYLEDEEAYLKIGLYKPDWLSGSVRTKPKAVSMMYGPVRIEERVK